MNRILSDVGDAALWAGAVAIIVWVVQYTLLAQWWRNFIGVTLVGEALCILAIFTPSLMGLADPRDYASFAQTRWYHYLAVVIVVVTAVFMLTRIVTWEWVRRQRGRGALETGRVAELEAEVAELRRKLG